MSVIPYLLDQLVNDDYDPFPNLYDQNFGLGLLNDELRRARPSLRGISTPFLAGYVRPFRHLQPNESGVSSIVNEKDNFKVNLDVQQFKPEEINVKVVDDHLVVEGKHEERQDKHGYISRQFTRRYKLPENVELESLKSTLSSDGILAITAPKKAIVQAGGRQIPVVQTNQPAIKQTKQSGSVGSGDKMES